MLGLKLVFDMRHGILGLKFVVEGSKAPNFGRRGTPGSWFLSRDSDVVILRANVAAYHGGVRVRLNPAIATHLTPPC